MLQEAGRICCDASAFEAVGDVEVRSKRDGDRTHKIRWVFGGEGEYRFEYDKYLAVFDGAYYFGTRDNSEEWGIYDLRAIARRENMVVPRGPHNRFSGDLVMASGMAGGGMTFPTAAMRELGKDWTDYLFPEERVSLKFGSNEMVRGHPCRKIVVRGHDESEHMNVWVDSSCGLVRKWSEKSTLHYMSACYDLLRVNPPLRTSEFMIPRRVLKKAKDGGGSYSFSSDEKNRAR